MLRGSGLQLHGGRHRRRPSRALLAGLAAVCAGPACVAKPEPLPTGVIAVMEADQTASFVRNFNPLLEGGDARWPTRRAMYEPMMIFNPSAGTWHPWLATGSELSADRTRIRFGLRTDVTWSDGAPFSARDVAFTFDLLHRFPPLDARGLWQRLESVSALDPGTVELVLRKPHAPAFEEIAQQAIVPEHLWAAIGDPVRFDNPNPVATGPFTEIRFFGDQAYEVGRNPRYWQQGKPGLTALRFRAYPANEPVTLALLRDELDWAGAFVPAIERVYVQRDPVRHHIWVPLLDATVFLYANTLHPPFDDIRARKAVSMSIDRGRIAKVAMQGHTRPADATGLGEAYARYRDPDAAKLGAAWVAHDEEGAGRLLDELGYRKPAGAAKDGLRRNDRGQPLSLVIDVPSGFSDWIAAAQIMAHGLRRVGVAVTVRASDYQAWFERLSTGAFDLSMAGSDLDTTPYGFYRSLMSTTTVRPRGEEAAENWHRLGLPETDAIFAGLEATADVAEEHRLIGELERIFARTAPAIPLFPGPLWGQFNSGRATGFPDENDPYAPLSPNIDGPQPLLVLTHLEPR